MDWSEAGRPLPREEDFGNALYFDYTDMFRQHSWDNEFYSNATLHLLLGQIPSIRKMRIKKTQSSYLDGRIHVCYLANSGGGKGEGANVVERMSNLVGIKYQEIDEFTDSTFVGSVSPVPRSTEMIVNRGWLDPTEGKDILAITEATSLLTPTPKQWALNTMNHLQKAMNAMGTSDATIVKKTGVGGALTVKPTCSIFLTSYLPPNLTDVVVSRGFLQRMYFIVRDISPKDRESASEERRKRQANPPDTSAIEISIADRFHHINRHYATTTHLPFSPEAIDVFRESSKKLYSKLDYVTPFLKEKLGEFITRFEDTQFKLSLHYACMNLRDHIAYDDAFHAMDETQNIFVDLVSYLERFIAVPKAYQQRYDETKQRVTHAIEHEMTRNASQYTKSKGWVLEKNVLDIIRTSFVVTEQTAIEYLKLMEMGKIIERMVYPKFGPIVRIRPVD